MEKQRKIAYFHSILVMFLSPAYSLFHGLRSSFSHDSKRWLLIIFITIYGSVMTLSESNDGFRHLQTVHEHYVPLSFSQFLAEAWDILLFKTYGGTVEDLYIHTLSYFVGHVLRLPGLFFIFVSFIYAYFYAGSIFRLLRHIGRRKYHWVFYGFLVVFILMKNIEGINTVRTWTGLWILFYACLSYYETKKKKYLILMFVPPLVHVGYFLMAIPAWIVLFAGTRSKLYPIIFALSFVVNLPNTEGLLNRLNQTEIGAEKVEGYKVTPEQKASEDFRNKVQSGSPWYFRLTEWGLHIWAVNLLAGAMIIFGLYSKKMNFLEARLFSIGILTIAFSNFMWMLFAVANRSGLIGMLFVIAALLLLWQRGHLDHAYFGKAKLMHQLIGLSLILLIPFIVYKIADLIYYVSIYVFAFPFIPWFTDGLNYSIREFIGFLI
ncbi:MAG TPA: EpsG family protein [Aequorivita sp.]|nr:EpsG family protein [Aequorivita sp.]